MTQRLLNKIAIITGSSSGLGRAISLHYAREGATVVCSDLSPSARSLVPSESEVDTHQLIEKLGGKSIFVKTDVSKARDMENLVESAVKEFGGLDIMVNNAGISLEAKIPGPVHTATEEKWDAVMAVNTKSVFLGSKYATKQMIGQDLKDGERGVIVNISSIMGIIAGTNQPCYSASKGAVSNLTRQVALDYAKYKIRVNAICPGYTQTAMFAETTTYKSTVDELMALHPLNGLGVPDDIAKMAVVLASADAGWVTGACIPVDGGYTAQ
ncbi:gluconate 5-dehydrogenase [Mollisia scopiformis]|uniref:Gluconate 5-dehydrogenase n=1 Tax=Mollisia scopiformis TaxID=149040 RepID=A0A194WWY3_MOLSC|nr:gluconate 5-dehydrogenase [Mollisia scopiformis]KUJ12194.1 gluconate 5-dehydrogenase [Mollisia scopiformis]